MSHASELERVAERTVLSSGITELRAGVAYITEPGRMVEITLLSGTLTSPLSRDQHQRTFQPISLGAPILYGGYVHVSSCDDAQIKVNYKSDKSPPRVL